MGNILKTKLQHSVVMDVQTNKTCQSFGIDVFAIVLEFDLEIDINTMPPKMNFTAIGVRALLIGLRHCRGTKRTTHSASITLNDKDISKILSYPPFWVQFGRDYGIIITPDLLRRIAQSITSGSKNCCKTNWNCETRNKSKTQAHFYYIKILSHKNNGCIVIQQDTSNYTYEQLISTKPVPRLTPEGAKAITQLLTPLLGLPANITTSLVTL